MDNKKLEIANATREHIEKLEEHYFDINSLRRDMVINKKSCLAIVPAPGQSVSETEFVFIPLFEKLLPHGRDYDMFLTDYMQNIHEEIQIQKAKYKEL